jgi:hypothetical protein
MPIFPSPPGLISLFHFSFSSLTTFLKAYTNGVWWLA